MTLEKETLEDPQAAIRLYHQATKHHPNAYAPGPGHMDWANQPDPFRRYAGAPLINLSLTADSLTTSYAEARHGPAAEFRPFTFDNVACLLELSMGLSAWKSYGGNRWALRCNPSSGNLHPTEAYVVCAELPGLRAGVYHYASREHGLEQRAIVDWGKTLTAHGVVIGLSSIHWREAWKYGARAYRYCQHDAGHAIAAVAYAASALGWDTVMMDECADADVAALLGLDQPREDAEPEHPDVLLWIGDSGHRPDVRSLVDAITGVSWAGHANTLSARHRIWPQIRTAESATIKQTGSLPRAIRETYPPLARMESDVPAATLFRQRRSAVAFDGVTGMKRKDFLALLDSVLPRPALPPWNAMQSAWIHLALFVHRIEGLEPGLYALPRSAKGEALMREHMRSDWLWERVSDTDVPLYLLLPHDLKEVAQFVSCHQEIAADSAFSLAMLAEFDEPLKQSASIYRRLFWEAGAVGQTLYLESEALGLRSTGIGCYFDDTTHELLGISDTGLQDLYHFTVGGPVEDLRLETLPPYAHLGHG